jgi:hypothetical protein
MAKLSAHGRKELARVERVVRPNNDLILWTRHTRVLMDDGVVLNKMDTKWRKADDVQYGRWRVSGQINIRTNPPEKWLRAQHRNGYEQGHRRHPLAAEVTLATMSDKEIAAALKDKALM